MNRNAYIECSIHGYGFCKSAYAAFHSLFSNITLVAAVNGISGLLLLMLKLMVATGTALIGYAMLWQKTGVTNSLYIILIVVGVLAFVIADAFCDLYATGIDTILLCFIEDKHCQFASGPLPPPPSLPARVRACIQIQTASPYHGAPVAPASCPHRPVVWANSPTGADI